MADINNHAASMLKLLVLWEVCDHESSGYAVMQSFAQSGRKISSGTIYPLLHALEREGLSTVRTEGRKKLYSGTRKGKTLLKELGAQHERSIREMMSRLEKVSDRKDVEEFHRMNSRAYAYKREMLKDMDVIAPLQDAMFRIYERQDAQSRVRMRKILMDAMRRIDRI